MLRADEYMNTLAEKHQRGTEKGGRSLLAKMWKLQEDLEVISQSMDRQVSEGGRFSLSIFIFSPTNNTKHTATSADVCAKNVSVPWSSIHPKVFQFFTDAAKFTIQSS